MAHESLTSLPSVGNYTAAAVRIVAYSLPDTPIDTNATRLVTKYFGVRKASSIAKLAGDLFSGPRPAKTLFTIMDFAALVCCKRTPLHGLCPVKNSCRYHQRRRKRS